MQMTQRAMQYVKTLLNMVLVNFIVISCRAICPLHATRGPGYAFRSIQFRITTYS